MESSSGSCDNFLDRMRVFEIKAEKAYANESSRETKGGSNMKEGIQNES